jgi:drug/metabolite transporter (DMT)-like permease
LIQDLGATRALTVTFLIPLFAIGWGWVVLGEAPTSRMTIGGAPVVVATALVTSRAKERNQTVDS